MKSKWINGIGWTLLVLFTLGAMSEGKDAVAATMFLAGVIAYWGQRINQSIQDLKK
jgi:hypothetical protein